MAGVILSGCIVCDCVNGFDRDLENFFCVNNEHISWPALLLSCSG